MFNRWVKRKILNYLLKNLFNTVTEDDILRLRNGKLYRGNIIVSEAFKNDLINSAILIRDLDAWKEVLKDLKFLANERMYNKSVSVDDMIFGKAMLYSIDLIERKIKNLSQLK
jgi:hypothetical protein